MRVVSDVDQAREIYEEVRRAGACMPAFNTENRETTEAIFRATAEIGEEMGIPDPPVMVAFTAHYAEHMNLPAYTSVPTQEAGLSALRSDLERLSGPDSPYGHVRAMVVLDHAHPEHDREIWEQGADWLAGLMYDCSFLPLEENMRLTKAFVREAGGRFLVEGAVDELFAEDASGAAEPADVELTRPEDAERYARDTGVFLLVVNVGTEHRASASRRRYHRDRAREISARVGPMLCLHGTSSVRPSELEYLREDGFVKVNIWTALERNGAQAIARHILEHLGQILPPEEIEALKAEGVIGENLYLRVRGGRPRLDTYIQAHRRDQVWVPTVVETMKQYFRAFGYAALAAKDWRAK